MNAVFSRTLLATIRTMHDSMSSDSQNREIYPADIHILLGISDKEAQRLLADALERRLIRISSQGSLRLTGHGKGALNSNDGPFASCSEECSQTAAWRKGIS